MVSNSSLRLVVLTFAMGTLVSCGPKDADKIGQAQLCLDKATKGTAAACMEKIAGIETKSANVLRCSAGFIDEGFTEPARFKMAFDALGNNSGSNTETFMGVLAFSSKSTAPLNTTFAYETYEYCAKSGAKGLMLLGSMAKTATTLSGLAGSYVDGAQPDASAIQAAITNAKSDPVAKEAIGSAIASTYTASCQTGQKADESLCTQLDAALVGVDITNSADVGAAILAYWEAN